MSTYGVGKDLRVLEVTEGWESSVFISGISKDISVKSFGVFCFGFCLLVSVELWGRASCCFQAIVSQVASSCIFSGRCIFFHFFLWSGSKTFSICTLKGFKFKLVEMGVVRKGRRTILWSYFSFFLLFCSKDRWIKLQVVYGTVFLFPSFFL